MIIIFDYQDEGDLNDRLPKHQKPPPHYCSQNFLDLRKLLQQPVPLMKKLGLSLSSCPSRSQDGLKIECTSSFPFHHKLSYCGQGKRVRE